MLSEGVTTVLVTSLYVGTRIVSVISDFISFKLTMYKLHFLHQYSTCKYIVSISINSNLGFQAYVKNIYHDLL